MVTVVYTMKHLLNPQGLRNCLICTEAKLKLFQRQFLEIISQKCSDVTQKKLWNSIFILYSFTSCIV